MDQDQIVQEGENSYSLIYYLSLLLQLMSHKLLMTLNTGNNYISLDLISTTYTNSAYIYGNI